MDKAYDLSKGYLPVLVVVSIILAASSAAFELSKLTTAAEYNKDEIAKVNQRLEVLPQMTIDIALIKRELGISVNSSAEKPRPQYITSASK